MQIYTFFFNCRNLAPIFRRILNFLARETAFCRELNDRKRQEDAAGWAGCLKSRKNLCAVLIQIARRLRRSNKRRYANIRRRSGAQHCSSLCSQSEGGRRLWRTYSGLKHFRDVSVALTLRAKLATVLRRNRRLCGPAKISAARALSPLFQPWFSWILNTRRGA